jgi:hypothetical protein
MSNPTPKTSPASPEQAPTRALPGFQGSEPPRNPPMRRLSLLGWVPLRPAAPLWPQRSIHIAVSRLASWMKRRMSQPDLRANSAPPERVPRRTRSGLRGPGQLLMVPSIPGQDRFLQVDPASNVARYRAAKSLAPGSCQPPKRLCAVQVNKGQTDMHLFPCRKLAPARPVVPGKSQEGAKAMLTEHEEAAAPMPSSGSAPPARFREPALPPVPRS